MIDLGAYRIAVVLLAAGRGTRMGPEPKLLLPLGDGRPLIRHSVERAVHFRPLEIVVVTGPGAHEIEEAIDDLPVRCVQNHRAAEGMGTSLAAGVGALGPGAEGVLVLLGDQPDVPHQVVQKLVDAHLVSGKPITVPLYGGRYGPPTLFGRAFFSELRALGGDIGGRQIIGRHPELTCTVDFLPEDEPIDIDTPEDYRRRL